MMQMYNPPHPGEILKELCLEPLDLSVTSHRSTYAYLSVKRKHPVVSPQASSLSLPGVYDCTLQIYEKHD